MTGRALVIILMAMTGVLPVAALESGQESQASEEVVAESSEGTDAASDAESKVATGGKVDSANPKPWNDDDIVKKDDGQVDSGYGFVPSAITGTYLQLFESTDFASSTLEKVCICWLKTRGEARVAFNAVIYEAAGNRPGASPLSSVPGVMEDVPTSVEEAGDFACVDMKGAKIPQGRFFIGANWNPKESNFAFVCNDRSPETPFTETYYFEQGPSAGVSSIPNWTDVRDSRDPIFTPHRAIMVRALPGRAEPPSEEGGDGASEAPIDPVSTGGEGTSGR